MKCEDARQWHETPCHTSGTLTGAVFLVMVSHVGVIRKPFLGNIWIVTLDEKEKHVSRQHKVESARAVLSVFVSI